MFSNIVKSIVSLYYRLFFRIDVKGIENIPENEGALICPNHISWNDPPLIGILINKRNVRFMAKNELFNNPFLKFFFTGVGAYPVKRGEPDLTAIKTTLKILKENGLVGLFPEGTRVKNGNLGKANPGVALFAIKSGKPVIPVLISGEYKPFKKIKITFGQPIYFEQYKKAKMTNADYFELSQIVMEKIKELKGEEF